MDVSARNQLAGTVKTIKLGGVMAEVVIDIGDGKEIVAAVTRGLGRGDAASGRLARHRDHQGHGGAHRQAVGDPREPNRRRMPDAGRTNHASRRGRAHA